MKELTIEKGAKFVNFDGTVHYATGENPTVDGNNICCIPVENNEYIHADLRVIFSLADENNHICR